MQYRPLGRTGLQVSLASLGTGGPSQFGQKEGIPFAEQAALIHRALDLGINHFDSAQGYGESEQLLGRSLKGVPRDRYLLATKVDPAPDGRFLSPEDVVAACERSLLRLGTDTVDIYQFHGVLPGAYRRVVEELYPAMLRLREQGKIRSIGLTERFFTDPRHETLQQAAVDGLWDTVMLKYGILNQAAARTVLPLCRQHGLGVLNMAPVRTKLTRPAELATLMRDWKARGLIPDDSLPTDDPLGWLSSEQAGSVISAGYKFAADHPAISTVITGTSRIAHLETNLEALLGPPLPVGDTDRLQALFGALEEPV